MSITKKAISRNKIFASIQTLGPSLTTGIAVIPLGGLMLGLSSILTNTTIIDALPFLNNSIITTVAVLFSNLGNLIINNLAIIFALSVAMSYSKKDSIAAFSAFLAFMSMHTVIGQILNITAKTAEDWTRYATVLGIPTINVGVLGGILVGLVTAFVYKRFKDTKLPMALSFFQGKRFVPIMSIIFGALLAIPICIVWPALQNIISIIAASSGSNFNVWIMAGMSLLTFSLMPFGLHTIIYATWAYQLGTYISSSGTAVHGLLNIFFAQIADGVPLTTTVPLMGNYLFTGTCIAVVLAIIKEATPENKDKTKSLFTGGIVTNFVTGITEPLFFPFVFSAPILYFLAVVFMFVGEIIVYFLNITVGISYCGGIVDFIIYGVLQNANNWYLTPVVAIILGAVTYVCARFLIRRFHLNVPGQECFEDSDASNVLASSVNTSESRAKTIIAAFGGKENILEIDVCATRLRVQVNDTDRVEIKLFTATGAAGVMNVGNSYQIVYGTNAPLLFEEIKAIINSKTINKSDEPISNNANGFHENILVPADGELIPLNQVNDKVFSEEMMGTGFGVVSTDKGVYSPVNGKIITVFPTKHAIGILSDENKEILLHIGIDTVKLKGVPFEIIVNEGDIISENQLLARVNYDYIKEKGFDPTLVTVFTNIPGYKVSLEKQGDVKHGDKEVIKIIK
ncbi:hypothetical protein DXA75_13245 [Thomasclavelia ramosa]|uniref:PTS transporter subunit IIABC n=1 Tax=Thomasclavelia ramosa TaxID=1547 RepID=UPI000E4B4B0F|nr:PTS transporter subunit IIABC [Thomasclavelia ramosa]RGX61508.1 hypothetical protein DXA75_13245 [Thomasclavelia ramosa]